MAYELTWLVEKRVLDLRIWDMPTQEEVELINDQLIEMADAGIAPVHLLTDESEASPKALPPDVKTILKIKFVRFMTDYV